MFTGLIEGTGRINDSRISGGDMDLLIMPFFDMSDSKIGDSVAVNGVCLTVTEMNEGLIRMYASSETTSKTTIGSLKRGAEVNLERAMKLTDRLGGHFVSGHVDGIGIISEKRQIKKSWLMGVKIDEGLSRYTIRKGSVAIDGISLTINVCQTGFLRLISSLKTGASTTLIKKRPGDMVKIETDLIAKYVERLLLKERAAENRNGASTINMEMLEQFGFGSNIK
jgi:riboflavin synthase